MFVMRSLKCKVYEKEVIISEPNREQKISVKNRYCSA